MVPRELAGAGGMSGDAEFSPKPGLEVVEGAGTVTMGPRGSEEVEAGRHVLIGPYCTTNRSLMEDSESPEPNTQMRMRVPARTSTGSHV